MKNEIIKTEMVIKYSENFNLTEYSEINKRTEI